MLKGGGVDGVEEELGEGELVSRMVVADRPQELHHIGLQVQQLLVVNPTPRGVRG